MSGEHIGNCGNTVERLLDGLTYLLTGNCLLYYRQLNPTWRLGKLNALFYLPRSHRKLSPEFITCHVVSRTFHVISKSSHCTSLLATQSRELFTTLFTTCHVVSKTFHCTLLLATQSSDPGPPSRRQPFSFIWRNFKIQN